MYLLYRFFKSCNCHVTDIMVFGVKMISSCFFKHFVGHIPFMFQKSFSKRSFCFAYILLTTASFLTIYNINEPSCVTRNSINVHCKVGGSGLYCPSVLNKWTCFTRFIARFISIDNSPWSSIYFGKFCSNKFVFKVGRMLIGNEWRIWKYLF